MAQHGLTWMGQMSHHGMLRRARCETCGAQVLHHIFHMVQKYVCLVHVA